MLKLIYKYSVINNIKAHFVFMPSYKRYFPDYIHNEKLSVETLNLAESIGFNIINLTVDFEKYKNPKKLFAVKYYNGYSEDANKLIADRIKKLF